MHFLPRPRRPLQFLPIRVRTIAHRAVVFRQHGNPLDVLSVQTLPILPAPSKSAVSLRFLGAPVNPSDLNVVEGTYPLKPRPRHPGVFIPGNEGVAEVVEVGDDVQGLSPRDWVILKSPQLGSWSTGTVVDQIDIIRVPDAARHNLSPEQLATITVNPPTAFRMLSDFVNLDPGDWVIQNGANSAVGRAVIEIARGKGIKTMNFVRHRDGLESLKRELTSIGATHVFSYDELSKKDFRKGVALLTNNANIRLALNCVGGKTVAYMTSLLGDDAHLVSYGAMSRESISLPTGPFIFKNLVAHGYWQSRWYETCTETQRGELVETLTRMLIDKELSAPRVKTVRLGGTDAEATDTLRQALAASRTEKLLISWS